MPYIGRDLNRGNYLKLDDISSSFDSSTTTFNLTVGGSAFTPGSAFSILVSVGGVIQEPESAYQVNNSEITFANAPTAQDSFFCIALGVSLGIGVPGNGTVNGPQMAKPFSYDGFFHLDSANNRVGIGSLQPKQALDIIGNTNISGILTATSFSGPIGNPSGISTFYNLRVTNNLTVEGTTTTLDTDLIGVDRVEVAANSNSIVGVAITQSGTADIVNLFDGTTEVLTVTDGGKVGIGSAVPAQTLDIMSSDPVIRLTDTDPAGVFSQIDGAGGDLILAADGGGGSSSSFISFRTDGTALSAEKVRITSTGEVGINTTVVPYGNFAVDHGQYGLTRISEYSHILVQNKNASTTEFWNFAPRDNGSVSVGRGVPGATGIITDKKLTITSDGKVGIGTDNPSGKLDISAAASTDMLMFKNGATNFARLGFNSASGTAILDIRSEGHMRFLTNGNNEKVRIKDDGKVGISENDPQQLLHINGGASSTILLGNTTHGYRFRANVTGTHDYGVLIEDEDGVDLYRAVSSTGSSNADTHTFFTAGSERLRITSDGQLELRKNQDGVTGRPDNRIVFKDTDSSVAANQPIGEISWHSSDAGMANINAYIRGINEATNGSGALTFGVKAAGSSEIEALRITSGGALLLGTGTRSNLENFHIHTASSDKAIIKFTNTATGTGTGDGFEFGLNSNEDVELMLKEDKNIIFGTGSTLGERLRINSSGQVGIGTDLSGAGGKFQVFGTNTVLARFGNTIGATYEAISIKNTVAGYPAVCNDSSSDTLDLRSMGSVQVTIDSNNNSTGKYFRVMHNGEGNSGTELFRIDDDGNVGINDDSPDSKFSVKDTYIFSCAGGNATTGMQIGGYDAGANSYNPISIRASEILFNISGSQKAIIDDYGVLRIGNTHDQTTSGNTKRIALGAKGSIWGWATGQINGALNLADNYYWDGANNKAIESDHCAYLTLRSGSLRFGTTDSSQTGGQNISGGIHERFRITSSGDALFSGLTSKNDPRNAKGISLKSASGISFQNYGANGSHNWRIRPDDMVGWGTLEFSVSPTSNSSTDWPDHADDVALCLKPEKHVVIPNGRLGVGLNGTPSATFEVTDGGDYSHAKQGWARKRTFSAVIYNNQTRWYKIVNYQAGNMLIGKLEVYTARGGGFNQTKGYNEWKFSLGGFASGGNGTIYGTYAENTSFHAGTASSVDIVIGTDGGNDENIYIKIPGSVYNGRAYFIFEGIYANWQFDESTYLTSAP